MILNEDFIPWNINIACIIINTALCQCFPWLGWNVFLFFPPLSIRNNMYTDWIEIGFISRNHTIWIVSCWLLGLGKCTVPNITAKYFYVLCINVWHVHLHKTVGTGWYCTQNHNLSSFVFDQQWDLLWGHCSLQTSFSDEKGHLHARL